MSGTVADKVFQEEAPRPNQHSNKSPLDASNDTNQLLCYSDFHSVTDIISFNGANRDKLLWDWIQEIDFKITTVTIRIGFIDQVCVHT